MMELKTKNCIYTSFDNAFQKHKKDLDISSRIIYQNDPKRNLKLGYCIPRSKGLIMKDVSSLKTGEDLDLEFSNGIIVSEVKKIKLSKKI
jgi:exonuclease VII large subunit